jgi:hypothetical protein
MKPVCAASVAGVLLALALSSCSPGGWGLPRSLRSHELRILLPAAPPSWDALDGLVMSISWRDPEGRLRAAEAGPGASLRIEVERGFPQAILALPRASGEALLPAGALYPEALAAPSGADDELSLDWKGGYAARIAQAMEGWGADYSAYELYTLVDEAAERAQDPWLVPPAEAARRLAEGCFRIDRYGKPKRFAVELLGPGPWTPESPFAAAPQGSPDAPEGATVSLPEGLWRFVGEGKELFVSVDSAGAATEAERGPD